MRYWFDDSFYEPGGPIFVLLGGETSGEDRLQFLDTGILDILSRATSGMGVMYVRKRAGAVLLLCLLTRRTPALW